MLSYLHGFHAGNFADVHKHWILSLCLESLNRKQKPWSYLETHAGRAFYDLTDERALKTAEYQSGIGRLFNQPSPPPFHNYLALVAEQNSHQLTRYPGSPALVARYKREGDKLSLMELHPAEAEALRSVFRHDDEIAVHHRDGYEGVLALLPPKPNRGVVLVDPSYEVKSEYQQVVSFISDAVRKWPGGSYLIWYPLLSADRHQTLKRLIKQSGIRNIYCSEIEVAAEGEGMYGSGMLLVNPPWQIDTTLRQTLPWLVSRLTQGRASTENEWLVEE